MGALIASNQQGSGAEPAQGRPSRRVLFTADDFGLSPGLNQAVALAHGFGLLRNASLMPAAPASAQAMALARQLPSLCLGVHLTLIQGRALLPPSALPRLVDGAGRFSSDPTGTGWRYFFDTRLLPEIRRELAAQIEAVLAAGLSVWHLNGHLNLHLHPRVAPLVVDLAREYGILALRLAREDWRTTAALAPGNPFPKAALGVIFALLSRRARALAADAGLVVNDHLFGLTHPGRITEAFLVNLMPRLQPGLTEVYGHPALAADPELVQAAPGYRRLEEFQALVSPRLQKAVEDHGVEVTDFRKITERQRRAADQFSP